MNRQQHKQITDKHIQYFWTALETLSQVTVQSHDRHVILSCVGGALRKFIKFACNQELIPFGDPCRGGDVTKVPPYPMKIAPPDGQGMV